jgi:nitrite reductase/ring-hydroxylating ferredoxin subunit
MRMTREAYAREVWKAIEAVKNGSDAVPCPHDNCEQLLRVLVTSVHTGTTIVCPQHGLIFRD